jgi:hypothetical protein
MVIPLSPQQTPKNLWGLSFVYFFGNKFKDKNYPTFLNLKE